MKNKILILLILLIIPILVHAEGLEVSPLLIKTSTKTNIAAEDFVKIKNLGFNTELIKITTEDPVFKLSSYGFGLMPEEEKELNFAFSSGITGVFTNKFFIRSEDTTVVLPVIVEVESSNARFDSTVETLDAKRVFYPGDQLSFSFTVFDLLEFVEENVDMEYYIMDMKNELSHHEEDTINVKFQKTLTRQIQLPNDIELGMHVLVVSSKHNGLVAFSTLFFNVVEKPEVVEEFDIKTFSLGLIMSCKNNGLCTATVLSIAIILFAILFIYIVEVVKLSRMPKKKIERAMKHEEKRKEALSLAKRVLKEAEEQKEEKKQEKLEEKKRGKIVEEMLKKQRKAKPTIAEKKLLEREVKKSIKKRKKLIKEKKEQQKRKKKIEKMLSKKK